MTDRRVVRLNLLEEQYEHFGKMGLLFLEEDIDECISSTFCLNLLYRHSTLPGDKAIWIDLNSPGGIVHHGLAIYDTIKAIRTDGRAVNILGRGLVASMATVILQAGTKRYSTPYNQFLLHQISETIIYAREEVSEGRERIEEAERMNDIVMKIISERCGIDIKDLKNLCKKTDYWLDVNKAKDLGKNGLIDEVTTRSSLSFVLNP